MITEIVVPIHLPAILSPNKRRIKGVNKAQEEARTQFRHDTQRLLDSYRWHDGTETIRTPVDVEFHVGLVPGRKPWDSDNAACGLVPLINSVEGSGWIENDKIVRKIGVYWFDLPEEWHDTGMIVIRILHSKPALALSVPSRSDWEAEYGSII